MASIGSRFVTRFATVVRAGIASLVASHRPGAKADSKARFREDAHPQRRTALTRRLLLAALVALLPTFGGVPGAQTTYQIVSDLGTSQGHSIDARLIRDVDGTLYGTATAGGTHNQGTVFRIDAFGVLTTLHSFDGTNGGTPSGGVVMGPDGYLYGTTLLGGTNSAGTLYRVHPASGSFESLYSFGNLHPATGQYVDGFAPRGGLVVLPDGMLYGTTTGGGPNGAGTIYRMTTAGAITVLYSFTIDPILGYYPGGFSPRTALVRGNDGRLYGTTEISGANGNGAIFSIDPVSGEFAVVHDFAGPDPVTGKYPEGRSVQSALVVSPADGTLYGAAASGGANEHGTVFQLTSSGVFTVLRAFAAYDPDLNVYPDGYYPSGGVTLAPDGTLYGTTQGGGAYHNGVIYKITTANAFSIVRPFGQANPTTGTAPDGSQMVAGVTLGTDGRLYGTTVTHGGSGYGTAFAYDLATDTLHTLHHFNGTPSAPVGDLVQDQAGSFYGVTSAGGSHAYGTVFRLDSAGTLSVLHLFQYADGASPRGGLVRGPDGAFYGTTQSGGTHGLGTIFKITSDGVFTSLHSFAAHDTTLGVYPDGYYPMDRLVAADGLLYGTAQGGGPFHGGVIFSITPSGTFNVVHGFGQTDPTSGIAVGGVAPLAGLTAGANGRLYGTTSAGGVHQQGTVFALDGGGIVSVLHAFLVGEARMPTAAMVLASDGHLYGTTSQGGPDDRGTVFRVSPSTGAFTTLHVFSGTDGAFPYAGLIQGSDGAFYGTTSQGGADPSSGDTGTVFRITAQGVLTTAYTFNSSGSGGYTPMGGLVETSPGVFYGTAQNGGPSFRGVVYQVTIPPVVDPDADDDGAPDADDNCPFIFNPDQMDADADGIGDACDVCPVDAGNDADGDSLCGNDDNCPDDSNSDQLDSDGDGIGDACDATPFNLPPSARTGVVTTAEGGMVSGILQGSDPEGATLTFTLTSSPTLGSVQLTDASAGAFTYTPNVGAVGYDTFTYQVSDGSAASSGTQMVFVVANSPRWPGGTVRASVKSGGGQGSGQSLRPSISANGRFIVFESQAPDLVAADTNGLTDVFLHDSVTKQTSRVSVGSGGVQANGASAEPSISADGRHIAFWSTASNLVANDSNNQVDVFVHDTVTGATVRVSVASDGTQGNGTSRIPVISADGRHVTFGSTATNLVTGDTNGFLDLFVHDRVTAETTRVSVATDGTQGNGHSWDPADISADGRFIAFYSDASSLVDGDINGRLDVFVHDCRSGETALVSRGSGGVPANGDSNGVSLSADGRFIAFSSTASNLVPGDTNGNRDVFVHDRTTGTTTRVSVGLDGNQSLGHSGSKPLISADGRYVAFLSTAANLVLDDTNALEDAFVRDRLTGITTRINLNGAGAQITAQGTDSVRQAVLSADGRFISWHTDSAELVAGDTNSVRDVFVVGGVYVSPLTPSFSDAGGGGSIEVSFVHQGSSWSAHSNAPWIVITNQSTTSGNGTVTYSVSPNTGPARTGTLTVAAQTVTITQAASPVPTAEDASVSTSEDTPVSATLSATDPNGDPLTFSVVSNGSLGTVVVTNASTGAYTYTPNPNISGTDSFTFKVNDVTADSNIATVTVTIASVNDAPAASDRDLTTAEDTAANGFLPAIDVDSPSLSFAIVVNGTKGTATITNAATGAFTYTPNLNANGADSFTFKASDGILESREAKVTVTITAVADVSLSYPSVDFGRQTVNTGSMPSALPLGSGHQGLGAGDLDGDGDVDLVVGNTFQGSVTVGFNDGSGQFVAGSPVAVGSLPNGLIVVTDFDGDGDRDVAVANQTSGTVSVLLNDGAGGLGAAVHYPNYPGAFSLAAGDLNADGRIDLVVASSSARPPLLGNGDGTFSPAASSLALGTGGPAVADFNDDGKLDVTNGPLLYLGNGDGTFGAPLATGVSTLWSAVGDFDGDGRQDLLGAARTSTSGLPVQVARGRGDGTFEVPLTFLHDTWSWAVAAGDLNGDLLADAVATTDLAGTFSVYLGNSSTGLSRHVRHGSYAGTAPPVIADLTGDGIVDLVIAAQDVRLVRGKGDGTFVASQLVVVSNDSGANALVGPLSIQGPDASSFVASLMGCQSPLQPGGLCRIQIDFYPTVAGAKSATLEIMTSDGPMYVALSGNAIVAPPAAMPDTYSGAEDSSIDVPAPGVRANDLNASGASISVVDSPLHGSLTLNADGSFVYSPTANFNGSDSFTYRLSNAGGDSNVATVSLTVSPVNDAPVASARSLTTLEDTPVSDTLAATDVDNTNLTYTVVANGAKGTAVITDASTGAFTYTPNANATGTDTFTFKANDGLLDSNVATVTITIDSVNDAPVAANGTLAATEDTPANGVLSGQDPDGDALTYAIVTNGTKGRATIVNPSTGAFVYSPFRNATGSDVFTFAASDGALQSNVATVTVTIGSVNDVPIGHSLSIFALEDAPKPITVAGSDADGDALTFTLLSGPSHGTLSGSLPNVTYTPEPDYNGADAFTFKTNDGASDSNVARVDLSIVPTLWTSNGPHTGIVDGLIADPTMPSLVYARSAGGVWKSTNAATNWSRLPISASLSLAPVPGAPLTLYAGTADGLYKSTDGGASWTRINTRRLTALVVDPDTPTTLFGVSQGLVFRSVDGGANWVSRSAGLTNPVTLVFDPQDPQTLYALANGSVFKTTDAGASWLQASNGLSGSAEYLAADPSNSALLYVGTSGAGIFKTTDGAATWVASNAGLGFPYVRGIVVDSVNSATVYAVTPAGVYRSTDAGASWVRRSDGSYYLVALDSANPATIYVGGGDGIFKSTDGAATWAAASQGFTSAWSYALADDAQTPDVVYAGSYIAGVHKTQDDGGSWTGTGLTNIGTRALAVAPGVIYAGGTCSGVAHSLDGGVQWTYATSGLTDRCVYALAVDASSPATVYAGTGSGVFKSTNTGANWSAVNNGLSIAQVNALAAVPATATVYAGTFAGVFKSTNGGESWLSANVGLPSNPFVNGLAIDPTNPLNVYAATSQGLFKSADGGAVWSNSNPGLHNVSSVVVDPADSLVVYIGTFDGVWVTKNGGSIWTALPTRGLASTNIVSIALSGETLYAGAIGGSVSFYQQSPNDVPTAANQSVLTPEATPKGVTLDGSDPDSEPLTFSIVTPPTHGTLTGTAPNITYTPDPNYNGPDSFTFKVNDGSADSNVATVSITVTPVNEGPVAAAGTLATDEDVAGSGTLSATDGDADALTFAIVANGTKGTAVVTNATTGAFTYTPNANANGTDTFTFKVNDGTVDSNIATVTVTINPVNDAPAADNQSVNATDATATPIVLTGSDADGDSLTFVIVTGPAHGTLSGTAPNVTYTASTNYSGPDSFTFKTNDGSVDSSVGTVSITVVDRSGPSVTITSLEPDPTNASPILAAITFSEPVTGFTQSDLVIGNGTIVGFFGEIAAFNVNVAPSGDGPVTIDLPAGVAFDGAGNGNAAAARFTRTYDGTAPGHVVDFPVRDTAYGSTRWAAGCGTPEEDICGKANDFTGGSGVARFEIALRSDASALYWSGSAFDSATAVFLEAILLGPAGPPFDTTVMKWSLPLAVAVFPQDGSYTLLTRGIDNVGNLGGTSFTAVTIDRERPTVTMASTATNPTDVARIPVVATFSEPVTGFTQADILTSNATIQNFAGSGGSYSFDLVATAQGPVSADIAADLAEDAGGNGNTAAPTFTRTYDVNDVPVASNGTLSTDEDTAASGTLSAADADGHALTFSIVTNGTKGTAVVTNAATGAFTYTPNANANGTDSFTFRASDGTVDSNVATIAVTIAPINDPPVAQNGSNSVFVGASVPGTLVATDIDSASLVYSIVTGPTKGTAVVTDAATGAYTYTAGAGASGTDTFTFKASDGSLDSNVATITVTIVSNRPPVANPTTLTTQEDKAVSGTLSASDPDGNRLTFSIVANGSKGTVKITNASNGKVTYTPAPNTNGPDTFTFKVNDGINDSNVATVTVNIGPVNDAPVAASASYTMTRNTTLDAALSASDVDGDPLTYAIVKAPRRGTITNFDPATGAFTYRPATGFSGTDSFTFRVSDGTATSATVTVSIRVN